MKLTLLLLIAFLLPACSNFEQRWKSEPIPSTPNTLASRWTGQWQSFTSHRGELRAIIIPSEHPAPSSATSQPSQLYHATFHATFWTFYTAEYSVDLTATPTSDGQTFTGSKDLGPFAGGLYHYQGTLRQNDIQTTYQSSLDHGTFTLHRTP